MKDIAKLNDNLRDRIIKLIEDYEKEHGVELTVLRAYGYYNNAMKRREIPIALGLQEKNE